MNNVFICPEAARQPGAAELFEPLLRGDAVLIERIVSWGQATPEGEWYDQERDEWVLLLEGEAGLGYANGDAAQLKKGDSLFLPRHLKHRVLYTSRPCIWLAVHGNLSMPDKARQPAV